MNIKRYWAGGVSFVVLLTIGFVAGQWVAPVSWIYYDTTGNPTCYTRTCFYWKGKTAEAEVARWESSRSKFMFADMTVIGQADKKQLTAEEVMKILYESPKVNNVSYVMSGSGSRQTRFDVGQLAYPQNSSQFMLSEEEWGKLQELCRANLHTTGDAARPDVIAHWKKIVEGTPPFGLWVAGGVAGRRGR